MRGLAADGIDYRGVLYAGVMVDARGAPWLLEYNCRFGDPETQPIMARMRGDLGVVLARRARAASCRSARSRGTRASRYASWSPRPAIPARRAPATRSRGSPAGADDVVVFHAGTARRGAELVTAGGRVLGVTALGIGVDQARARAYAVVDAIELPESRSARDIGQRAAT